MFHFKIMCGPSLDCFMTSLLIIIAVYLATCCERYTEVNSINRLPFASHVVTYLITTKSCLPNYVYFLLPSSQHAFSY
jgi:hypothetical protein